MDDPRIALRDVNDGCAALKDGSLKSSSNSADLILHNRSE